MLKTGDRFVYRFHQDFQGRPERDGLTGVVVNGKLHSSMFEIKFDDKTQNSGWGKTWAYPHNLHSLTEDTGKTLPDYLFQRDSDI